MKQRKWGADKNFSFTKVLDPELTPTFIGIGINQDGTYKNFIRSAIT